MISWKNPSSDDRDLDFGDYRRMGVMDELNAVVRTIAPDAKVHAVGYSLGGILLTIAAATMGRDHDNRLASVTLFTTLTDFSESGDMAIFLEPSEVSFLEDFMWERGYIPPEMWTMFAPKHEGSWWPAWEQWLSDRSTKEVAPPPMGNPKRGLFPLAAAPGTYVLAEQAEER